MCQPRIGPVDLFGRNGDFLRLRFLNLQRLVDQIAQHLHSQPLQFLVRDCILARGRHQCDALIDIGAGDNRPVDHCGRGTQIGRLRADHGDVCRQVERIGGSRGGLRRRRGRRYDEPGQSDHGNQIGNRFAVHLVSSQCSA